MNYVILQSVTKQVKNLEFAPFFSKTYNQNLWNAKSMKSYNLCGDYCWSLCLASVLEWHHLFYFKMPDFPKELNSLECEEKACGEFLSQKAIGYILLLKQFHCTKCRGRTQMIKVTSNSANLLKDTSWQRQNETAPFTQEEVSLQMPTCLSFRTSFLNFQNSLV